MFGKLMKMTVAAVLIASLAGGALAQIRGGRYRVQARDNDRFPITAYAGQMVTVYVKGDGDTDLDLVVLDENGNKIAEDMDNTDECLVRFTPRWTGQFVVVVINRGKVYNDYVLGVKN